MKKLLFSIIIISLSMMMFAKEKLPKLNHRVNDTINILSASEKNKLEANLAQFEQQSGSQIAVLIIKTTGRRTIEDYSINLAEKWKIGKAKSDNGLILVVALGDRKVRLEVGYGLEPVLTDLKSAYIIDEIILPNFRKGNFAKGISSGLSMAQQIILKSGDISPEVLAKYEKQGSPREKKAKMSISGLIFALFLISLVMRGSRRGRLGGPLALLFLLSGSGSDGRGGSGFGGGSGGGFSGGGGSFGGGGASGGW